MNLALLLLLGAAVTLVVHLLLRWPFYLRVLVAALFSTAVIMVFRLAESLDSIFFLEQFVWFCVQIFVAILIGLPAEGWRTRKQPRSHVQLRFIAKWTGVMACALIAATWFYGVSLEGKEAIVRYYDSTGFWAMGASYSAVTFTRILSPYPNRVGTWTIDYGSLRQHLDLAYWRFKRKTPLASPNWHELTIPLWLPFVLFGTPTAILCYLDFRRVPPGHCSKCGYNLTGNVSGICPECGAACAPSPSDE